MSVHLRAWELVNEGALREALELLDGAANDAAANDAATRDGAALSLAERMRGGLAIRLDEVERGMAILEVNRAAGITAAKVEGPYRFTIDPDLLGRATRGLFDGVVLTVKSPYTRPEAIAHVRVVGWCLEKLRRKADAGIALAAYRRWSDAALAGGADVVAFTRAVGLILYRFRDRAGVRDLERHVPGLWNQLRDDES